MLMSHEDVGIYIRLLCVQHQHGGHIEKEAFKAMVGDKQVIKSKFIETEDGFFNKRLFEEMIKRQKKSHNLSDNAKKGWKNRANAMQMQSRCNAEAYDRHMPTEIENEDVSNTTSTAFDFELLWQIYPNKLGKKKAEVHFKASVKNQKDYDDILKAVNNYLLICKTMEPRFIKHGSTFFNNWKDYVDYKEPSGQHKLMEGF